MKNRCKVHRMACWRQRFLAMLPMILNYVVPAFQKLTSGEREEAVQEAIANTFNAYARLVERGRENLAFATVLARFAIAQVRSGRRVGGKLNVRDVLSPHCRRKSNIEVRRLDRFNAQENCWQEAIVADERTSIPDQVAFKIDFAHWLDTLSHRDRQIAEALADGFSTTDVSGRFGISLGRVSQLRRKFEKSWMTFQGEQTPILAAA